MHDHSSAMGSLWRTWDVTGRGFVRNRRLLWQMVTTDLRGRYVESVLGFAWSIIHPLALVGIFVLVFSRIMGARIDADGGRVAYGVYLCAGLLPWTAFQEVLARSTTVFVDQANLTRKINFPPAFMHGYVLAAAALNLAFLIAAFLFILLVTGSLRATLIGWPLFLLLQLLFGAGLGLIASIAHVFFRDTAQLVNLGLQVWFWLTPIVYPIEIVPKRVASVLFWNPAYLFTRIHQSLVVSGRWPTLGETFTAFALPAVAIAAGLALLEAAQRRIPDEL
jgi:homopolymeric O-antigen transport system permease protein